MLLFGPHALLLQQLLGLARGGCLAEMSSDGVSLKLWNGGHATATMFNEASGLHARGP